MFKARFEPDPSFGLRVTEVGRWRCLMDRASQREIERVVRRAIASGQLGGDETLKASARIQIERIVLDHRVEGEIALS